jgi:hypothetical protein
MAPRRRALWQWLVFILSKSPTAITHDASDVDVFPSVWQSLSNR